MSSQKTFDRLSGAWSMVEWITRRHLDNPDDPSWARFRVVEAALKASRTSTDRELCRDYPEIMERALTLSEWEKCKP